MNQTASYNVSIHTLTKKESISKFIVKIDLSRLFLLNLKKTNC